MTSVGWRLLGQYLPHRDRRTAVFAVAALAAAALEAVVLVLTVSAAVAVSEGRETVVVDLPLVAEAEVAVATTLWLAVVAVVGSAAAGLVVARLNARMSSSLLDGVRAATLRAFSRAAWARQESHREGALSETISNQAMQASTLVVVGLGGLNALLSLAALVVAALLVDVVVTLAVVGLGGGVFLLLRPITRLTRRSATLLADANAQFAERVSEASGLALELRVFGVEGSRTERLVEESHDTAQVAFLTRFATQSGAVLYRNAAVLFLVLAVAGLHAAGDVGLTQVGAVVILMVRALSYAQQLQTAIQRSNELSPNLVLIDRSVRELDAARRSFGETALAEPGEVSLRSVSFRYDDDSQLALRDVSVDIAAGEMLGVVGPSGSGKSTLVQLLMRLRLPTAGEIRVDGISHVEIASDSWSRLVSLVPQEPRLFEGTVAENIAFHRPEISRAEIVEAAAMAHVADEIERMPEGFDTRLGPRGAGVSGGQRQRLAFARALVGRPRLLVLDEPTSALDVRSEELLRRTIDDLKGRITLVVVAHRLSTIAASDRLMVLVDGSVAALGASAEVRGHPFVEQALRHGA